MGMLFPVEQNHQKHGGHEFASIAIELPKHDADLELILPNGERISLQWRVESPSLDVCLPLNTPAEVCNWTGEDMQPAPCVKKHKELHYPVHQLVLNFDEKVLSDPDSF